MPKQDAEIIRDILKEDKNSVRNISNDLRIQIYDELRKSDDDIDCDLIDENIRTLTSLAGQEYKEDDIKEIVEKIREKENTSQPQYRKILNSRIFKPALTAGIVVVSILTVNFCIVQATENNIFDSIVRYGRGIISYDFKNSKGNNSTGQILTNSSLYDTLKQDCNKYDLSPMLPKVLPYDFKVKSFDEQNFQYRKTLSIYLANKTDSLALQIRYYPNQNDISEVQTASATDLEKIIVNGKDVYFSKEGDKILSIFSIGNYVYNFSSTLSSAQTIEILKSLN
jgi:hypothetical protein